MISSRGFKQYGPGYNMEDADDSRIKTPLYGFEALIGTIDDKKELKIALEKEVERNRKQAGISFSMDDS